MYSNVVSRLKARPLKNAYLKSLDFAVNSKNVAKIT